MFWRRHYSYLYTHLIKCAAQYKWTRVFLQFCCCVPAGPGHWEFPVPGKDSLCPVFLVVCFMSYFVSQSICLSVCQYITIASFNVLKIKL